VTEVFETLRIFLMGTVFLRERCDHLSYHITYVRWHAAKRQDLPLQTDREQRRQSTSFDLFVRNQSDTLEKLQASNIIVPTNYKSYKYLKIDESS